MKQKVLFFLLITLQASYAQTNLVDDLAQATESIVEASKPNPQQIVTNFVQSLSTKFNVRELERINNQKIDLAAPIHNVVPFVEIVQAGIAYMNDPKTSNRLKQQTKDQLINSIKNMSSANINQDLIDKVTDNEIKNELEKRASGS